MSDEPMPAVSDAGPFRLPPGFIPRVCAVAGAATIASGLILISFEHASRFSEIIRDFEIPLVYSYSIALPSAVLLYFLGYRTFVRRRSLRLLRTIGVLTATNTLGCLFTGVVLAALQLDPWNHYWPRLRFALLFGMVITLTFGLGMDFYEHVRSRLDLATLEEERVRKLAAEARLSSLESRIHPHFLFNTLNSISSLIPKDPKRAEDVLGKFAALLRSSLNASQMGLAPLGQEIQIVRDYLEIEKTRFDARLRYSIDVPAEMENLRIPPLSLETLVENSIKHVIAQRPAGGEIRVRAAVADGRAVLEVSDDGPGFALDSVPLGHGLDNLAARLALLFGGAARLEVARDGKLFTTRMSFPQ
ncbi:MAG: sensor histidine kinase [Bryobacteraceae bacterium]